MKCPACETSRLVMSERQGVEIDYCPECRGVWLDRGELDKLIDRASSVAETAPPRRVARDDDDDDDDRLGDERGGRRGRRKGSFLGEIFDIGG